MASPQIAESSIALPTSQFTIRLFQRAQQRAATQIPWTVLMINVEGFRQAIRTQGVDNLLDTVLMQKTAAHVSIADMDYIRDTIARKFSISNNEIDAWVCGSAKLGFSIIEKKAADKTLLPRYRPFSAISDVDVAIVSPKIFDMIWYELSSHAHRTATRLPWNSGPLGDYLVCGWVRPDYFPKTKLRYCEDWWEAFNRLSADARYGRRKVRGALFYSTEQMKLYWKRALNECLQAEGLSS